MIIYVVAAIALIVVGAAIGAIFVVSLGIRREEAAASMTTIAAPDRLARAARVPTGLYARRPGVAGRAVRYSGDSRPRPVA